MSEYGTNKKQICFESVAKTHADLKIRLHHDGLKIKEFFNAVVKEYLKKNENMMKFIEEIKEKKRVSKNTKNKNKRIKTKEQNIIKQFALDPEEIENIFDILEKEHPDL